MNEELNLKPYREAWQAEKERLQAAPPRHTEQDIAAMLSRHDAKNAVAPTQSRQRSRTLPIWLGSAAASVAILVGVAWLLWLRPTADPSGLPTLAELRTSSTSLRTPSILNTPSTPNNPNNSITPIALTTPPSLHSHTILSIQESNDALLTDTPIVPAEDTQYSMPTGQPATQPTTQGNSAQPQLQAFQEMSITGSIEKQKTPKDPLVRTTRMSSDWTSSHPQYTQIALSGGASFTQDGKLQPLVGIGVTHDSESKSVICANNQAAIYLLGTLPSDTTSRVVSVQYGYGLSCRPTDRLTLRVNLGGFIQFVDFDLGLRLNAEMGYRLSEDFILTASYQYYMPGIVSGDSRHAAILSVGYFIN